MRPLMPVVFVGIPLLAFTGCEWGKTVLNPPSNQARVITQTPTSAQLVAQLNSTSQRIQSIECRDVWIEAQAGHQPVSLPGDMLCAKNRNFRLMAKMVGQPAVDIGSNEQEFWFWISKAEPPGLYHCTYQDLYQGRVRNLPFPFQPEWVMEALGMADRDPNATYEPVRTTQATFDLIQKTVGPQGQPVVKVTQFSRTRNLQVVGHRLEDTSGKEICTAQVLEYQYDNAAQVALPRSIKLTWPAQQLTMKLKLENLRVNGLSNERAQVAFARPQLRGVPTYDLARGPDQPVQRTGGVVR